MAFAVLNLAAMLAIIEIRYGQGWETVPFHFIYVSFTILYGFRAWRGRATLLGIALCHHHDGRGHGLRHPPQLGGAAGDHRGAADVADVRGDGLPRAPPPAGPGRRRGARRRARARPRAQVGVPVRRVARAPHPDHDRPRPHRAHAPQRSPRAGRAGRDVPGRPGRARTHGARDQAACSCSSRQARAAPGAPSGPTPRPSLAQDLPALAGHGRPRLAARRPSPPGTRRRRPRSAHARTRRAGRERRPAHGGGRADRDRRGRRVAGALRIRVRDGGDGIPEAALSARVRPLLPGRRRPQPSPRRRRPRPRDREGDRRGARRQRVGPQPSRARAARSSCACPAWAQQGTSRYPPPRTVSIIASVSSLRRSRAT